MKNLKILLLIVMAIFFTSGCSSYYSEMLTSELSQEMSEDLISRTRDLILLINQSGLESISDQMSDGFKDSFQEKTLNEMNKKMESKGDFLAFANSAAMGYEHPESGEKYHIIEQEVKYEKFIFKPKLIYRFVYDLDGEIEAITIR